MRPCSKKVRIDPLTIPPVHMSTLAVVRIKPSCCLDTDQWLSNETTPTSPRGKVGDGSDPEEEPVSDRITETVTNGSMKETVSLTVDAKTETAVFKRWVLQVSCAHSASHHFLFSPLRHKLHFTLHVDLIFSLSRIVVLLYLESDRPWTAHCLFLRGAVKMQSFVTSVLSVWECKKKNYLSFLNCNSYNMSFLSLFGVRVASECWNRIGMYSQSGGVSCFIWFFPCQPLRFGL